MRFIIFFSFWFFFACSEAPGIHYVNSSVLIEDSLTIADVGSLSEFMYMESINDSTIKSYNVADCSINYYKFDHKRLIYKHSKTIHELPTRGYLPLFFKHNNYYYQGTEIKQNASGVIYKYDTLYRLVKAIKLTYSFKYLGNNFMLDNGITSPLISRGDTIISVFYHNDVAYIPEYYKENSVAEFVVKKDSIIVGTTYINKPLESDKYGLRPISYCFNNNTVFAIYPIVDSIYSYNRSTKKEIHFSIGNEDFSKPHYFKEDDSDDYFKRLTDYELENFRYGAILFNPITKHYIIFYYLPLDIKQSKKLLSFRDQKEFAIILNEKFEILKYVKFDNKYFNQANYFFIPGKGIAMPLFKSKSDYENIKYYIYNF